MGCERNQDVDRVEKRCKSNENEQAVMVVVQRPDGLVGLQGADHCKAQIRRGRGCFEHGGHEYRPFLPEAEADEGVPPLVLCPMILLPFGADACRSLAKRPTVSRI